MAWSCSECGQAMSRFLKLPADSEPRYNPLIWCLVFFYSARYFHIQGQISPFPLAGLGVLLHQRLFLHCECTGCRMRTENCSKNFSQKTASQVLAVKPPSLNWEFRTDFLPRQNNTWVAASHQAELLQKRVAEWTGRILNNRFTPFLSISI